jgi:hypothetical protein
MQTKTPPLKQNELNIQDENSTTNIKIIDVWADNLEDEMEYIRQVVEKYPYIAMVSLKSNVNYSNFF